MIDEHALSAQEELERDPFALSDREIPVDMNVDIDWDKELYDWKPRLLEVSTDSDKPGFRGRKSDIV